MKRLAILGSTGSIGRQALDVIRKNRDKFAATVLSCNSSIELFTEQLREFSPSIAVCGREEDAIALSKEFPKVTFFCGEEGLRASASEAGEYDMLVNALMGMRGLSPSYEALLKGRRVALANKESLVAGGELIMGLIEKLDGRRDVLSSDTHLLPIDSEHSAVFQCLQGESGNEIESIILTCSGGPFRGFKKEELKKVGLKEALAHPKWSMGPKITIDSATLMNKGLEMIEAHYLFKLPAERIDIHIHPESIVHSAVRFTDGAVIAQLAPADMRLPISHALSFPERLANDYPRLDLFELKTLSFEKPDRENFRAIDLAYRALSEGSGALIALNAANEVLVQSFIEGRIGFADISEKVEKILDMESKSPFNGTGLDDIICYDREVRGKTLRLLESA